VVVKYLFTTGCTELGYVYDKSPPSSYYYKQLMWTLILMLFLIYIVFFVELARVIPEHVEGEDIDKEQHQYQRPHELLVGYLYNITTHDVSTVNKNACRSSLVA